MARIISALFLFTFFLSVQAQDRRFAQPDLPGDLMLDIGLNYWTNERDTLANFGSKSLGVYYTKRFKISNNLSFYPGVGLGFEKYSFKKNYHYANVDGNIQLDSLNGLMKKNKLAVTYFDVPLELRFHPKGTIEGEGFFVGAGVFGGLKMGAHTKLKYEQGDAKRKEKLRDNFGLEDYRYGYIIRVGWKGINFYYRRTMSQLFQDGQQQLNPDLTTPKGRPYNPQISTFGINFTGF